MPETKTQKSQDVIATNGILFCSLSCLIDYAKELQLEEIDEHDYERDLPPEEWSAEKYGCLCPVCEKEYWSF